jgi:hypothetical protein
MQWAEWAAAVKQAGGRATVWPFDNTGRSAAAFPAATYVQLYNGGHLPTDGTQASGNNQTVYVLASAMTGSSEVDDTAPHTMTAGESVENATFTALDSGADALGLPSLSGIESFLTGIGRDILVGVAVAVAVAYVARRRR